MNKLLIGISAGIGTGFLLGFVLPIEFFLMAGLVLIGLAVLLFVVFHLGLRDFQ